MVLGEQSPFVLRIIWKQTHSVVKIQSFYMLKHVAKIFATMHLRAMLQKVLYKLALLKLKSHIVFE
jgi:hypothetical protein